MRRPLFVPIVGLLGLVACSTSSSSGGSGQAISVTASNSQCLVSVTKAPVGTYTFEVHNTGNQTTEVYLYAPRDKVVSEKENIGPGTTARFTVKLARGYYQVACKPGQKGSGIRQDLTVA